MLEEPDLTPAERALCMAAAAGQLIDRRTRRPGEDNPARGRGWGKDRQIRAQLLRQLLTGQGCLDQTFGAPLAVRLRGAQITGRLNLGGLTLRCPLELYGCFLGARLDLAKVKAPDISLRGSYLCQRLSARRLRLDHNLNLSEGFHCCGPVKLLGAHIGGELNCERATFTNPNGWALSADGLIVDGGLSLRGAQVTGEVRLPVAHIGVQLACNQATLTNPKRTFTNPDARAFTADRLVVDGSLFLSSAQVTGEVRLAGANVGGQLVCEGTSFMSPRAWVLVLQETSVKAAVVMRPARLEGSIDLTNARVGGWYDDEQTWPAALRLEGFVYKAIGAPNVTPRYRLDWLRRHQGGYVPQPYEQLIGVYRRAGRDEDARTIAINKQRARRRTLSLPGKAWGFLLDALVGYGHRTWLAGVWLLGFMLVGWVVFDLAHPTYLIAPKPPTERPLFHAGIYTLDLLLPVGDLNYQGAWIARGWARGFWLGWILAGWVLTTAVLAALAGILKRD